MGSSAGLQATLSASLHSNIDKASGTLNVITEATCTFRADASGSWLNTYFLLNSHTFKVFRNCTLKSLLIYELQWRREHVVCQWGSTEKCFKWKNNQSRDNIWETLPQSIRLNEKSSDPVVLYCWYVCLVLSLILIYIFLAIFYFHYKMNQITVSIFFSCVFKKICKWRKTV